MVVQNILWEFMMIRKSALNKLLMLAVGMFSAVMANAANEEYSGPAYKFGGVTAYPGIGIAVMHDSNIFRLNDADPAKVSSVISVISPALKFLAQQDANEYSLAYKADLGYYNNSSADNYVDQNLLGIADLELTSSATLKIMPEYLVGHDDRGSTYGVATSKPNTWDSAGLNGTFGYGAEEARGHIDLDAGYTDRQYQNNRSLTVAYDRKITNVGGTVYLRVQPKTSLLFNVKQTTISYKDSASILSSREQRLMLGAKWEATAQTTGEVKIGQVEKKFDSGLETFSGSSWEGLVRWTPVSYVKVDVISSRQPTETTFAGSRTILLSLSGVNVAYDVNDRVTLHANGYQTFEDFVGADRLDRTNSFGLRAEYKFRNWLLGGVEYTNNVKTSSDPLNDYTRNIFMLNLRTVM